MLRLPRLSSRILSPEPVLKARVLAVGSHMPFGGALAPVTLTLAPLMLPPTNRLLATPAPPCTINAPVVVDVAAVESCTVRLVELNSKPDVPPDRICKGYAPVVENVLSIKVLVVVSSTPRLSCRRPVPVDCKRSLYALFALETWM